MIVERVGDFRLEWGESLVWDDQRRRLYFVDCVGRTLHWLDEGSDVPETMGMPSMPCGVVPTDRGRLVACLDDGLHLIDVDTGAIELLAPYPAGMGGRANDACADPAGNLITGTLNLGPEPGSAWRYAGGAWSMLDADISNTNGPQAGPIDDEMTLIIGDTAAHYYSYPYDPATGQAGERSVFGDVSDVDGSPDGSALDGGGGLWCALVGGGQLARFTAAGLDRTVALPTANPTDVAFGGAGLDRMYVVSIGMGAAEDDGLAGALLAIDGLGVTGRDEPRFAE